MWEAPLPDPPVKPTPLGDPDVFFEAPPPPPVEVIVEKTEGLPEAAGLGLPGAPAPPPPTVIGKAVAVTAKALTPDPKGEAV
jgi:hypothetical protein|tara:strand:+ start:229 stop:474 length:246 start_codon:yes stop_codon:yes gene_type:complete